MEKTFTPEICQDKPEVPAQGDRPAQPAEPARYTGTVTVRMPTYDERLSISEETGIGGDAESQLTNVQVMRVMAKHARARTVKVDVTRKADGFKFESWEQLEYDSDMVSLINEIGAQIVGRYSVGNPSSPS